MKKGFAYFLLLFTSVVYAQDTLTLDKAITIALENSNLLKASRTEKIIASKDVSLGSAGFLPSLVLNAGSNTARNNIRQELNTGAVITRNDVPASNINGSASFSWLLFDGFRRIHTYSRLKETYAKADAQTKADIESIIGNISSAYFELVRQQEIATAYTNNLQLYQERLRLAEARQANGLGSKGDVLLTKVDINTQRSTLLRQQIIVENAKVSLNQWMAREIKTPIIISKRETKPLIDSTITFSGKSSALLVSEKDISIFTEQYKENNASYLPKLTLLAGYNYTRNQSQAGLTLLNRSVGPTVGLNLTWNIFDGFNKNRLRSAGLMRIDIAKYLHEENKLAQYAAFEKAMTQFKIAARILALETESYSLALESNELAKQRYQAGSINLFEYKETQLALEASKVRLANARFESLATETELNRLNGALIK